MREKRFIVVGNGSMGRRRIRHALNLAGATVGIFDIRPDRMDEAAGLFNVVRLKGVEAFKDFAPDGIFICVPPAFHEIYIDWALENNVNFMVEQPISHLPENMPKVLKTVKEKGLIVHVSNNHRFSAEIAAIKKVIDSKEYGPVLSVMVERGEWLPDWHPYEPYQDYYPSRRQMGGGLDAICEISWLRYLFGEIKESLSLAGKRSSLEIDTPDVVDILMRFENGVMVTLHTDMLQRTYTGLFKFILEEGIILHQAPDDFIQLYSAKTKEWQKIPLADQRDDMASMKGKANFNFVEPMYEEDAKFFIDAVNNQDKSTASLEDGIACLNAVYPLVYGDK